ncbi:MAG: hypothetical protein IT330_07860 [Anaerolineae bacterium]|nr:hypothetical protein [Anaerolineae bacterium]
MNRRQFLKLAGVAGALTLPTWAAYDAAAGWMGETPPDGDPYVSADVIKAWPSSPIGASPILVLLNERGDNPFGAYLGEILRAEGLNCFQMTYLSGLDSAPLAWYDLILLSEGPLDGSQVELLDSYVKKGGRLVAMRPDARLASLFGLASLSGSTAGGYLKVEASQPIAQGIPTESLQYHGSADHYRLDGAQAIAWLSDAANTQSGFPAVTIHRSGQGQAALWAFDLARSVAYTRQGNPAWANRERDGENGIRTTDMFKGWVDLDRIHIPQADYQQRLLANLLSTLSQDARPLPRLWYFPGKAPGVFIATGDCHGNRASSIEDVLARVERRGGHMSIYYTFYPISDLGRMARRTASRAMALPLVGDALDSRFASPTPSQVAGWRARGHEFSLHPYVEEGVDEGWRLYWKEFTGRGCGPVSPTTRTHRILWTGWAESARHQTSHGIRMNLDFYHWGPAFRKETGEWVYGHLTGSGLPMRFVDEQGRILNIYQQLTQLADDHLLDIRYNSMEWGGQVKLSAQAALEVSETLLSRSVSDHCAIAANFHPDIFFIHPLAADEKSYAAEAQWVEGTLDYVGAQGIPIWSAKQWLDFTEVRHDARFEQVEWHAVAQRLSFRLSPRQAADAELSVLVPLQHGKARMAQIEVDGKTVKHEQRTVSGVAYAWVAVPAGSHQIAATYA